MQRREKRELREREIIEKSIALLSQRGFLDLRMADIASETKYSMGTIYSHFESKEDLLVACALTLVLEHRIVFNAIADQPVSAIEKIITTALCSWQISMRHPDLIEIDNLSLMPSVWRRATKQRANELNQLHVELAGMFLGIVVEAIETSLSGYEQLDRNQVEQLASHLTHGMWGLCVGLSSTAQSGYASTLCPDGADESDRYFYTNYSNFLKGYGWQEENPEAVFARCRRMAQQCIDQTTWFSDARQGPQS
ncbi:transcriptional regulator, TetR family [Mariprofundus ferrinatatus]|uniref:Transcriptional regulator, TetR family n=1 Tax=Mariprofundus ferrinatatus TaxID=1921087 RepID=A0A2K8L9T1_9PROT|nr:TetR/AcrR family transcriptional regulator [Mariprofundus ferrinatatus]ATX81036.1 transcriptional regulator, TetR family [Mariprofundus ferrinatatus]